MKKLSPKGACLPRPVPGAFEIETLDKPLDPITLSSVALAPSKLLPEDHFTSTIKLPHKLLTDKSKDPLTNAFSSQADPTCTCYEDSCTVVQTRNMIKAQNIAATENTSVQASSSTKPIKTPKTDVVKNQNSPEYEIPNNNQNIPSVSPTQTHPLDFSVSTQSSKFEQSSKSEALNPSVSDYVECDLPQVISTPHKDRLKNIADVHAPSIDKDNDQKDIQPPNNISPDKNSVSKISDSASSSNIHSTGKYLKQNM